MNVKIKGIENGQFVSDWKQSSDWNLVAGEKRIDTPTPLFFVSVASKRVSLAVSLLFATLAERFICVAVKGFTWAVCWRESNALRYGDVAGVWTIVCMFEGWKVWRLAGSEQQKGMKARLEWETGGRGWGSGYTGEDSTGVARG
jgi:hypothetical protein